MGVSLAKGGNVSLSKEAPNLTAVTIGLGWDVRATTGTDFDLDASALVAGAGGKVLSDQHFVFYNNLRSPDGAVEHTGDNLTGEGDGDDESINIDLVALSATCSRSCSRCRSTTRRARPVVRAGAQRIHPRRRPFRRP